MFLAVILICRKILNVVKKFAITSIAQKTRYYKHSKIYHHWSNKQYSIDTLGSEDYLKNSSNCEVKLNELNRMCLFIIYNIVTWNLQYYLTFTPFIASLIWINWQAIIQIFIQRKLFKFKRFWTIIMVLIFSYITSYRQWTLVGNGVFEPHTFWIIVGYTDPEVFLIIWLTKFLKVILYFSSSSDLYSLKKFYNHTLLVIQSTFIIIIRGFK